jgi:adenylate cyclase
MAGLAPDVDAVVRRIPDYRDSFWREIIAAFNETRPGILGEPTVETGSLIRYLGPNHTFPYLSYYQALNPTAFLPKGVLKDHIVLVGRDVDAGPEVDAAQADMFATPFTLQTRRLTPGVELHANVLENVLLQCAIRPASSSSALLLLALSVAATAVLMPNWRPLPSAGVMLALLAAIMGLDWGLFEYANYWLPAGAAASGVVFMYLGQGAVAFLTERKRRQELKLAFSRYVAPPVIEEIIEHPERLVLGGERREITIMFTDLGGFTAFSERLSPEEVAQILIQHFTEMTAIILRYGGTVDKFIGDAIMAFWGAPIHDPEQGVHACRAALEMQQVMRVTRKDLRARGLPEINMRIGIHSGEAVVGNLGSESRFDYTAVGDNVNLASRLEGVNKLYGTEILLTDVTASQVRSAVRLRRVDRVRVKGKSKPVEIFTLAVDDAPLELNDAAIEAYRNRNWDASTQRWREWLDHVPEDCVAHVYLKRIEGFRREPPVEDWDGSIALEKM